jgi:chromosome segregation ATPase
MAPPYLSATGRELFEELENCWNAIWQTVSNTENEVSRVNLDYVGALQSVYRLTLELADARSELADAKSELANTRSELAEREAEHARMRAEIARLALFANRAGRTQAAILQWLWRHKLLQGGT